MIELIEIAFQRLRICLLLRVGAICFLPFSACSFALQVSSPCDSAVLDSIKGEVSLPLGCVYRRAIKINESNVTLNCNGALFLGDEKEKIGLLIDSEGRPLSRVSVSNCRFKRFLSSGVRVTWNKDDSDKPTDPEERFKRSPREIVLDNLVIEGSGRNGVYLDDYVSGVTLKNSIVSKSGGGAVYLDFSSKNNQIIRNRFSQNGFSKAGSVMRGAVSIDSSSENLIAENLFKSNFAGGVFLYKNCGERGRRGISSVRWMHSNKNSIKENIFIDEKIGIWLASRQSRDLKGMNCVDPPVDPDGKFFRDYANENIVEFNTFCRTVVPVRDEGGRNAIVENKFDSSIFQTIQFPVGRRAQFTDLSPVDATVKNNRRLNCDSILKKFR